MKYLLALLFIAFLSPLSASQYKTIIVGSFLTSYDAQNYQDEVEAWAMNNREIQDLKEREGFHFVSRPSGNYWIVALEPIKNRSHQKRLLSLLKLKYKDAFIAPLRSKTLIEKYQNLPTSQGKKSTIYPANVKIQEEQDLASDQRYKKESVSTKSGGDTMAMVIKLAIGVAVLAILVIVLLYRQRRSERFAENFENIITDLSKTNSELSNINHKYEGSIKEQEDLIEGMSVKIKDPAKAILGRAERILETKLSDKQSIEMRNIQDSGQFLFAIVDDLLDFMKIRSNKLKIEKKPFNLNELLEIIVNSVIDRIEKKDVEMIFDIEKSVAPRLVGDPIRIGQVLTNLLENGIKFTNAGEVRLRVKSLSKKDDVVQLMFEIIDTGIGIPESKLDEVFTPFYQIQNTNSAGLGLSISKALIEMMGGEILVSTEINRGSTFTFVLGLQELNSQDKRHYRLPDDVYKERRILIIDYHESAANAIQKLLEYFHNSVDIYTKEELDLALPDLSNYEMLFISEKLLSFELIKKIDPLKRQGKIKVVVVGSMLHKMNNSNLVEKLADSRLMKPVNQQNIFDLLVDFYGHEEIEALVKEQHGDVKPKVEQPSTPKIVIQRTQKQDVHRDDFVVFKGSKVLVAEDNIINQKVISSLLKDSGIELQIAANGEIAVDLATKNEYDLVLMDISMPIMNGYEATEKLKNTTKTASLPIVALTGNTMPDEIKKMKDIGMDDRLEKPIKVQALYSVFSKFLEVSIEVPASKEQVIPDKLFAYEEALERCGGDSELYRELVDEFIKLYKNSDDLMQKFLSAKDGDSLKALSLDIKGVGSNIGLYALANTAQKLNKTEISSNKMPKYVREYQDALCKSLEVLEEKLKHI